MTAGRQELREALAVLVARYRAARRRVEKSPALRERVAALATFQAARLAESYADLRRQGRYRAAVEFFLRDLYGPQDLSARDEQMLRALDKLQKFLPAAALEALSHAFELHVLTIELDAATADALRWTSPLDAAAYAAAYRAADRVGERIRQVELIGEIGRLLDSLAHRAEVGLAVRVARGPAHAAGYGQLQDFLERGYHSFRAMNGADEFLETIDRRERALMERILAGTDTL